MSFFSLHQTPKLLHSFCDSNCIHAEIPHSKRTVGLLASSVPDLHFSLLAIVKSDQFRGELDGDGGHDVVGYFIAGETISDVCFACSCISHEDD